MTPMPPAFLPADGAIDVAITLAVMVIAFIGWIVQLVGKLNAQPPQRPANRPQPAGQPPAGPAGNRPRPRNENLQSEIDAFLKEVAGGRKPTQVEEGAIEVIEEDEPPARRTVSAPVKSGGGMVPTGQTTDWDREQQRRRERAISTLSERHLDSAGLGADLRNHVEGYMKESHQLRQEKEQVERRLAEARAEIQAMRAQTAAGPAAAPLAGRDTTRVSALLKNRRSVKDAIVINEILGRPKGLKRER